MLSTTRIAMAAAAGAALLMVAAGSSAAAGSRRDMTPNAVTGPLIKNGADGTERTLYCPPDENVLGGGFTVSPGPGRHFDPAATDVLADRPTSDATGWVVAVRKNDRPADGSGSAPADLTLSLVCTQGEVTPGG